MSQPFDMQKAREICSIRAHVAETRCYDAKADREAADMLPAALDEIERLQADKAQLHEQLTLKIRSCDAIPLMHAKDEEIGRLVDRIAEQDTSLDAAEALIHKNAETINGQQQEIDRLQKVISEPIESFGAPELVAWAAKLQKIIAEYPEEERGNIPFVMTMGCHLEQFAKSWNSGVMKAQAKRIAELEATQKQLSELVTEKENVTIIVSQADEVKSIEKKLVESNHRNLDLQYMVDSDTATITKQRAALKKLGKRSADRGNALVEERAKFIWRSTDSKGRFAESIHTSMWNSIKKHNPEIEKDMSDRAREQLHREGKL